MLALCGVEGLCTFHCSVHVNVSEQPKAIEISKTIVDNSYRKKHALHTIVCWYEAKIKAE
jgi:hypothetical protein